MGDASVRVLQIVTYMSYGGLETMLMNYYRNIDRERIQFDFLEHRKETTEYDKEIESLGGRIYRLPKLNPLSGEYRNQAMEFFKKHSEYRIVHAHINSMSGLPLSFAKKAGVPIRIAHSHNTKEERNFKLPIKNYYKRQIEKFATDRMACGQKAGRWLFGGKSFSILNNAIDTNKFLYQKAKRKSYRRELNIHENDFVIGHVGRFFRQKNHSFLLDTFKEIHRIVPESKLLLVGEGPLQKNIQKKTLEYGLQDNVIFFGVSSKVGELLSAMDVFLFPSFHEGFPVTLIEAQTSGLRCFVSDSISDEVDITENIYRISLKKPAKYWADSLIKNREYVRSDTSKQVIHAGFDISANTEWLTNKYISLYRQAVRI